MTEECGREDGATHDGKIRGPGAALAALWAVAAYADIVLLVLAPFTPKLLQNAIVYGHLLVAPLLVWFLLPRERNVFAVLALVLYVLVVGFHPMIERPRDFALVLLPVLSAIGLYKAGGVLARLRSGEALWLGFIRGIDTVNVITLAIIGGVMAGWIEIGTILKVLQKDETDGLFRFALGNAIEVPFVLTAVLCAAIHAGRPGRAHPFSALLNLTTAFIAQSRLVVVIAALLFVREYVRARRPVRWALLAVALAAAPAAVELVRPLWDSILARFGGQDFGSADDRQQIVRLAMQQLDPVTMIFGRGLTECSETMRRATGVYRTMESSALQIFFECGLVGSALLVLALVTRRSAVVLPRMPDLMTLLLLIEVAALLPVFALMPAVFFAFGVLLEPARRATGAPGERRLAPSVLSPSSSPVPVA